MINRKNKNGCVNNLIVPSSILLPSFGIEKPDRDRRQISRIVLIRNGLQIHISNFMFLTDFLRVLESLCSCVPSPLIHLILLISMNLDINTILLGSTPRSY